MQSLRSAAVHLRNGAGLLCIFLVTVHFFLLCSGEALRCNGKGDYARMYFGDRHPDECICFGTSTGYDCSRKQCPTGRSWFDVPSATDTAHAPRSACSDAGVCDDVTGTCKCMAGFEGAACERLKCPVGASGVACSGHGSCMSLAAAAAHYDGRNFSRPGVVYDGAWDAHKVTGCVCDFPYHGFNCSAVACPKGDDPLTTASPNQNEVVRVGCQADAGSLRFAVLGRATRALSYAASAPQVKAALEALPTVGEVTVSFSAGAAVCAATEVETAITFTQAFGRLPNVRVQGVGLSLGGDANADVLRMFTRFSLSCGACGTCAGGFYLEYDGELTAQISNGANAAAVQSALSALSTLGSDDDFQPGTSVAVSVGGGGGVCAATAETTTIDLVSTASPSSQEFAYGNLHGMSVINSVYDGGVKETLTISHALGTKENAECSNHGLCHRLSGNCDCFSSTDTGYAGEWASSNGYGASGSRGDCGFQKTSFTGCAHTFVDESSGRVFSACDGKGVCEADFTCSCIEPFFGPACTRKRCPSGPAWFAEPSARNVAHAEEAECSNNGYCDEGSGVCVCREGFEGTACERLKCPSANGLVCSGHGRCLSMYELAQGAVDSAFSYGNLDAALADPLTWDAHLIFGCVCDGGDARTPYNGPVSRYSGSTQNKPFTIGYTGADCSLRRCPHGDDPVTGEYRQRQIVKCVGASGTFTLHYGGSTSASLNHNAMAHEVEAALTSLTGGLNTDVYFSSGHAACNASYGVQEGIVVELPTTASLLSISTPGASKPTEALQFRRFLNYTEVQTLRCVATSGTYTLSFRGATTTSLAITATEQQVETALEELATIQDVTVHFHANNGAQLCNSGLGASEGARIRFKSELGDVPLISATPATDVTVLETVKGDRELVECSNRGYCNREVGICDCDVGYASSDGEGLAGRRGDCSYYTGTNFLQDSLYEDRLGVL